MALIKGIRVVPPVGFFSRPKEGALAHYYGGFVARVASSQSLFSSSSSSPSVVVVESKSSSFRMSSMCARSSSASSADVESDPESSSACSFAYFLLYTRADPFVTLASRGETGPSVCIASSSKKWSSHRSKASPRFESGVPAGSPTGVFAGASVVAVSALGEGGESGGTATVAGSIAIPGDGRFECGRVACCFADP